MAGIAALSGWLEEAVAGLDLSAATGPIAVADFGCSEGRNSIAVASRIIEALRSRSNRPVQTIHVDLPSNNFNQLFANLYPKGQQALAFPDVFSAAVGGSMYDQLLPPGTITLAMTFNAIGWLDERPQTPIPEFILPMRPKHPRPGVSLSADASAVCANQAHADLIRFYEARARELVPGARLLVATFGGDESHRACDGIYDLLNDAILELVAAGEISRRAYERLIFPVYFRTADELVKPLTDPSTELGAAFRVDRIESMDVPTAFSGHRSLADEPAAYVKNFSNWVRAFTEPVIRMELGGEPGLDAAIEHLYERMEMLLAANPAEYEFHYIQVAALLTRR
jgi:hypothetical protein